MTVGPGLTFCKCVLAEAIALKVVKLRMKFLESSVVNEGTLPSLQVVCISPSTAVAVSLCVSYKVPEFCFGNLIISQRAQLLIASLFREITIGVLSKI